MITHPAATACYGLVNHLHARCMSFRLPSSTPGPCYYSLLQPVHTPACAVYVLPAAQQHRAHRAAQALAEADRDGVKQGAQGGRGVASGHHLQPQPQGCGVQGLTLCIWCWTALWHLDALCYEGCEGHGSANRLPQPRMELAERSHEQTYLGWYC